MTCNVTLERFVGGYGALNGAHTLSIRPIDLARAMTTVGYQDMGAAINEVGFWRALSLFAIAFGYFEPTMKTTQAFANLEATEKVGATFIAASGFTLLASEAFLGMRHMLHLKNWSAVGATPAPGGAPSKSRLGPNMPSRIKPDFVGLDNAGDAHAMESKGASAKTAKRAAHGTETLEHALDQVSRVALVNGVPPLTRTAQLWSLGRDEIAGRVVDPDVVDAVALTFDRAAAVARTYAVFMTEGFSASMAELPEEGFVGVQIGGHAWLAIDRRVKILLDAYQKGFRFTNALETLLDLRAETYQELNRSEASSVGPNGVAVFRR